MAKGLFGGLFGGQGLQMVGKLTKQNMEKLQASKPHDEKNSEDSPLRKLRDAIAKYAVNCADALIKRLKEVNNG